MINRLAHECLRWLFLLAIFPVVVVVMAFAWAAFAIDAYERERRWNLKKQGTIS